MTQHAAASYDDPKLSTWVPSPGSADADLLTEQKIIYARARDLVRNNPIASGASQTFADNIVGSQLRLSSKPKHLLLGWEKQQASDWANTTESQFSTWADTTECDASRTQTLLDITTQALKSALVNGDGLAVMMWVPRQDSTWSTRIQTIEADRLQTPPHLLNQQNMRNGVEIDQYGAPVAYWINRNHPGEVYTNLNTNPLDFERVPAFTSWGRRRVIHLFDKERSGQSRGKSIFAAVMREFRISGEYLGAELHAAAANALIAAFIESTLPDDQVAELFGSSSDEAGSYWKTVADKFNRKKLESGMFMTLPVGTRLSGYNPNRPNTAFDGFMESIMRHIAAGINIPYELLLKDFSKSNYSSARAALLEAWRYFYAKRGWLQRFWLNPIYECWLEEAVNAGRVEAPDYYQQRHAYNACRWVFAGRGWVDPVKEANAAKLRMDTCLSTQEAECAEQGVDWEDVQDQRVRELTKALDRCRAAGLPENMAYAIAGFDTSTTAPNAVDANQQPDDDAENTDTQDVGNESNY
jgi:lambda family phage portal protein